MSEEYLIPQLRQDAATALLGHLSPATCIDALQIGDSFDLPSLRMAAARYLLDHWSAISSSVVLDAGMTTRQLMAEGLRSSH